MVRRRDRVFSDFQDRREARKFEKKDGKRVARHEKRERQRYEFSFRPRRNINVVEAVASPQDLPSRPRLRMNIVGVIVAILFGILILRLWNLQILNHSQYSALVNANEVRTVTVPAPRGLITASTGTVLVGNQVKDQIVLSRVAATTDPSIIGKVAALIGKPPKTIKAALTDSQNSPYEPVPIITGASTGVVQYLEEHQSEYPGVSVQQITERTYPGTATVATPILGYVSAINATEIKANKTGRYSQATNFGQSGLEAQYQNVLAGHPGTQELSVNADGQVVGTLKATSPSQGDAVVTNINLGLQKAVQAALVSDMQTDRNTMDPTTKLYPPATSGAAVVMNVKTGAVLAMASEPTYSLSDWLGGISQANYSNLQSTGSLENYATQGLYTPGSSFKLASATAALQTGLIGAYSPYDDTGTFKIPGCKSGCTFHDNTSGDAGEITMPFALTESDDDYFYNIGYLFSVDTKKYGPTPIQNIAHQYGMGDLTGIDIPGEEKGRIDSPTLRKELHKETPGAYPYDTWFTGTNMEMAFGQGETVVTPIEMADAYATFANGGTRYQPEIAADIVSPGGKIARRVAPKVDGHVNLPPNIKDPILTGLEGVVASTQGTAHKTFVADAHFSLTEFRIAGKTGTADIASETAQKEPDSWFIAFGPIPNPTYVVAVAVGEGGYGASAAAPAVISIFNYLVTHPIGSVVLPKITVATPPPPTTTTSSTTTTTSSTTTTTSSTTTTTSSTTTTTASKGKNPGPRNPLPTTNASPTTTSAPPKSRSKT